jgi:hypothetical protein
MLIRSYYRHVITTFGLLAMAAAVAPSASAGCGDYYPAAKPVASLRSHLKPASFVLVSDSGNGGNSENAVIVGLWSFTFVSLGTAGIPDGTMIDAGYVTWHADGTELTNSGRPPLTGSFCMGVWQQGDRREYNLNHWALSWDSTGQTFQGPGNIKENVTMDETGNNYTGTFTIDQYL